MSIEDSLGGTVDRSKLTEARNERLEKEVAEVSGKSEGGLVDRTKIQAERKIAESIRAQELKKTIEERLTAVEEQVGLDGEKPLSKEGLLNRNFGK